VAHTLKSCDLIPQGKGKIKANHGHITIEIISWCSINFSGELLKLIHACKNHFIWLITLAESALLIFCQYGVEKFQKTRPGI